MGITTLKEKEQILPLKVDPFLARLYERTGKAIALPPASALTLAAAWTKCLSFTLKFFKVMGKALSGELFCTWTGLVGRILSPSEANRKSNKPI